MDQTLRLTEPIAPQLIAILRQAILDMRLRPGEALSENEVAGRFGISRQPVREAFIKLAEAGLLEIRPSRGTYVMKISVREVANARLIREAVESDVAAIAARLLKGSQIVQLRALVAEQREIAAEKDFAAFTDADERFHRSIAEMVSCDYAWRIVEAARFQTDRVRLLSFPNTTPLDRLIGQHEAIVDAIEARDDAKAGDAMRRHLREILLALPAIASAHPEHFSDTELPEHTKALVPSGG